MKATSLARRTAALLTLTVAVTLSTALVGIAPALAGDERPCVSQQEYRDVEVGWRQARVADHFDTNGVQIAFSTYTSVDTIWRYRKCSAWGPGGWYVGVGYRDYDTGYPDRYMRVWQKVPNRPEQLFDNLYTWTVSPLSPDGGGPCVTQREYRDVQFWSKARVANHFDTRGSEIGFLLVYGGEVATVWQYRKCSTWGPGGWYVGVSYDNFGDGGTSDRDFLVNDKVATNPSQLLSPLFEGEY